ncbi:MAG: aldose epimerase family protein, partial [Waterburya sp.]
MINHDIKHKKITIGTNENIFARSMLRKFLTVFTMMGVSLLVVNIDSYKGLKPNLSEATENNHQTLTNNSVTKIEFGQTQDGQKAALYTLTNANGLVAKITNYGAILTELHLPDNQGQLDDVVLGFDTLKDYFAANRYLYFGAVVGRVANRIKDAQFTLDGQDYNLAANATPHHIHGGIKGFDKVVWQAEPINSREGQALKLTYLSPDSEEGYPGNLKVASLYTLTNNNELKLEMTATTDKPTPVNLVNHSYCNLAGHYHGNILGQYLTINADQYTPTDQQGIPTGKIKSVKNTPYDFTQPQLIKEGIYQL